MLIINQLLVDPMLLSLQACTLLCCRHKFSSLLNYSPYNDSVALLAGRQTCAFQVAGSESWLGTITCGLG